MSFYAQTKSLFNKYQVEKDVANLRGNSKGFSKAQKSGGGASESKIMAKDTSEKDVHPQSRMWDSQRRHDPGNVTATKAFPQS